MKIRNLLFTLLLIFVITACAGPVGPAGEQGPQGNPGEQGPIGFTGADGSSVKIAEPIEVDVFCGAEILPSANAEAWTIDNHLDVWGSVPSHDCGTVYFVPSTQPSSGLGNSKVTKGVCWIETSKGFDYLAAASWIQAPDGRKGVVCQVPTGYIISDSGHKNMTGKYPNGDKSVELTIVIP